MQKKSPQGLSGAIGGPAATRGMNYQIDNAILSTLDLISKSLSNQAENFLINYHAHLRSGLATAYCPCTRYTSAKLSDLRSHWDDSNQDLFQPFEEPSLLLR